MTATHLTRAADFWRATWRGNFSRALAGHGDLLIAAALVGAIGMIIFPLPAPVISLLLVVSLAVSLLVVLVSLYISSPVQLASYPTILLLTTLFRFCLSISVTRAILGEGHAGAVVETLGQITGGGDLIVGLVVFLIILVVQFIVVTKGAERVAEVAARFTLDALPGKQMAIDADVRAGLVTQQQARASRAALQKESQLYGAMDGAMKFVKGDSIATLLITAVNIVAGLAVGVLRQGLDVAEAAERFTVLTIGDGLAAIIPSVLIAVSAGLVVTRVSADEDAQSNVGADISRQMLAHPKPLGLTAALLFALLAVPGLPKLPLVFVGGVLALVAYSVRRARRAAAARTAEGAADAAEDDLQPTFSVPLAVVVGKDITPLVALETESGARFRAGLPRLRSALYYDLGVMLPHVFVSGDAPLPTEQYFIAIREVPVVYGSIKPDCLYVNDSAENISVFGLEGESVRNPAELQPGAWIPREQRALAEASGLVVWEPAEVITLHLSHVMKRYAHEFIGLQEAQGYLDFAARGAPQLVEEVVGKIVTINQFTDVLQRLVQEGISIRDVKAILDALAEWGRMEKDAVMLTEYVRTTMKRYISFRYTQGRDTLFVHLIDPEIEDVIRGAVRRTPTGSFLLLDPSIAQDILAALRGALHNLPPTAQRSVLVTDIELRRFVRKMVELEFPDLSVLSFQELAPELNIQPVARISLRAHRGEEPAKLNTPAGPLLATATS